MAEKFETWAIVELFGHQKIAGLVSNQEVGGASFIRVDVPVIEEQAGFTKLYGASAIYSMTITDEATARAAAQSWRSKPMEQYTIEHLVQQQASRALAAADVSMNPDEEHVLDY